MVKSDFLLILCAGDDSGTGEPEREGWALAPERWRTFLRDRASKMIRLSGGVKGFGGDFRLRKIFSTEVFPKGVWFCYFLLSQFCAYAVI